MNVFFLSRDPAEAARFHADKHVVKMILESAQLLSTAHRVLDGDSFGLLPDERNNVLYRTTHKNHPTAVWVRRELDHYRWVHDLLCFLIVEFNYRYGKSHATERLQPLLWNAPQNIPMDGPLIMEEPPQCMPEECKHPDTVIAYRTYYIKHKYHIAQWKLRGAPEWWTTEEIPK
jgi:hypothetical protein